MKCDICLEKIDKNWNYCICCGNKIEINDETNPYWLFPVGLLILGIILYVIKIILLITASSIGKPTGLLAFIVYFIEAIEYISLALIFPSILLTIYLYQKNKN